MTKSAGQTANDVQADYISLHDFAHGNVPNPYPIELMAGFYHTQETAKPTAHLADTEENWHSLIKAYSEQEVK